MRTREEGLALLLQMALAYADCENMLTIPDSQKPTVMKRSVLDAVEGQVIVHDAVQTQLTALRLAFEHRTIPPRPDATRRVFGVRPDLRFNLVRTLTILRQKKETRTPLQENLYRAHLRDSEMRAQIFKNIEARKRRRKRDAEIEEGVVDAEPRPSKRARKKKPVPLVPHVPLLPPAPRAARAPPPDPEVVEGAASARISARRKATRGRSSQRKSAGRGTSAGRTAKKAAPSRGRKRRSSVHFHDADMFDDDSPSTHSDSSEDEDFTERLRGTTSAPGTPTRVLPPRPRPVYRDGSRASRKESDRPPPSSSPEHSSEDDSDDAMPGTISKPRAKTPSRAAPSARAATPARAASADGTASAPATPRRRTSFVLLTPRRMLKSPAIVEDAMPGPLSKQKRKK